MASVTGLTALRMLQIEAQSIVDGEVQGDNLILSRHDGQTIDAGSVRGPQGIQGPPATGTVAATPNTIAQRTAEGRLKIANGSANEDAANMGQLNYTAFLINSVADQANVAFRMQESMLPVPKQVVWENGVYKLAWPTKFNMMATGRHPDSSTGGYFEITQPPNGTVIAVHSADPIAYVTVANGQVPLLPWDVLFYIPPFGQSFASVPANFRIVRYSEADPNWKIPSNWVMVAACYGASFPHTVRWGDGTSQGAWVPFPWVATHFEPYNAVAGEFYQPGMRVMNDRVELRGLARLKIAMSAGIAGDVAALPTAYRPQKTALLRAAHGDVAVTRFDIQAAINPRIWVPAGGWGVNTYISLEGLSYSLYM